MQETFRETSHLSLFKIDAQKGELFARRPLDFERFRWHQLAVIAEDGGATERRHRRIALIDISVMDINDNQPVFLQTNVNKSVRRSLPPGSRIFHAKAVDR